jgi:hypothetical protein
MSDAYANEAVLDETTKIVRSRLSFGTAVARWWGQVVVIAIALLLWIPRLSGPIDLRWDAGVYYLLGTSLAQGHGYRIPSEPGSPEALQYPPLLPAVVALYERALGSTDPAVVAPWLRTSYAMLFLVYALAALVLARRYLRPTFAVAATALCLLHFQTIFLSDLLFAELPFALVTVLFALVASNTQSTPRSWLREPGAFTLAAAGFLLRTAGVALLAAWVLEALTRRRWRLALGRSALALLPIIAWQAHVARVRASDEYAHPAYQYQRAPYQFYNVSYADNVRLLDPFRPELGRMNARAFITRLATNLPSVLASLGEGVSTKKSDWRRIVENPQHRLFGQPIIPGAVAMVPIFGLAAMVLAGLILLLRRGAWLMVFIVLGSVALVWTTPWHGQFTRYLMPLACFLSICVFLALSQIADALRGRDSWASTLARVAFAGLLALIFGSAIYTPLSLFRLRASQEGIVVAKGNATYRLFAHVRSWQDWEEAAAWINAHAPRNAIVATSAPHFLYLCTGLRAVLPPMESDAVRARLLLETVPVSYVIVDNLEFVDVSRRYARPAVESDSTSWHLVQSIDETKIYERDTGRQ